jgi:uncharacterized membrane protein YtjA (UPF0391 family)
MTLLKWAAIFFVIALIAAGLGFSDVAEGAGDIVKVLFYIFLGICIVLLILGAFLYKKIT